MASFNIRASMFPFARCSWFCLLDPSFPLFSCDPASFRKGAQLSPLKVRVRSLPPRDVLTVIASHYCLLRKVWFNGERMLARSSWAAARRRARLLSWAGPDSDCNSCTAKRPERSAGLITRRNTCQVWVVFQGSSSNEIHYSRSI